MRLLPFREFSIETPLAPNEVASRLRQAIEPARMFSPARPSRPFVETVDGASFDVMRAVTGRNSFRALGVLAFLLVLTFGAFAVEATRSFNELFRLVERR